MIRECPNCRARSIPVRDILFSTSRCADCGALVGVHRAASFGFNALIVVVTCITTLMVLAQSGLYAALLWFSLPVGSLSYIKARFSPLEIKDRGHSALTPEK